jgi:hypothetical protein
VSAHDRCCPLDDLPGLDCTVCEAIAAARSEEKSTATAIWKANLRAIESRNYLDGYRDATNGRTIPDWVIR